jgi:anti-sigma-K factor RskA
MNRQEFLELSAGHALHALSPADEQLFTEATAAHPEWAGDIRADRETAALLGSAVPSVTPSAELRGRILDQIGRGSGATAPAEAPTPRPSMARRGWFALAASLVVLLVLAGVGALFASQIAGPPTSSTALAQIQRQPDADSATEKVAGGGTATVHWSDTLGKAVLVSDGMARIPSGKVFELWYVRDGTPTAAGTFTTTDGKATAPLSGSMHLGDTIAVTVEPHGGSPTGAPTTTPIVAIPTS